MQSEMIRDFISWYNNNFKLHGLYKAMERVSEDSPWHRERTVATHTDMVVSTLLALQSQSDNQHARLLALFAAAFHDVGKPSMRFEKHSEERGTYYSYKEHELRSARLWQDFYMTNRTMMVHRFGIQYSDFYTIAVMIEKHRPWGMKDKNKISALVSSIQEKNFLQYLRLLEADNSGRITDSADALPQSMEQIVALTAALVNYPVFSYQESQKRANIYKKNKGYDQGSVPQLIIPIASAGSGKSSAYDDVLDNDPQLNPTGALFHPHSMDIIRRERYGNDPEIAFRKSLDDPDFRKAVQDDYIELMRARVSVYVDNTNLSAKRRRFYITEAQRRGYDIHAFLFPLSIQQAIDRNTARTDKKINASVVVQQYLALSMPMMVQEFDTVTFIE